jgi:hypothetical protein
VQNGQRLPKTVKEKMKNKIHPIKLYFDTALHVFSKASDGMRLEKRNRSPTIIPKNEVGTPARLAAFE